MTPQGSQYLQGLYMPHTDAISLTITLGLLLIILKIVSVVSVGISVEIVGVSVEIVGVSVVKEEVSVVISVKIVEVSVATFALFPSLRQISILSGLFFSSTVGILQPLSFHPFCYHISAYATFLANSHKHKHILDDRISANTMPSFVIFFHTDKHSAWI